MLKRRLVMAAVPMAFMSSVLDKPEIDLYSRIVKYA